MGLSLTTVLELWIAVMVAFAFGFWLGRLMARWKLIRGPMTGKESMIGKIGVIVRNQKSYTEARVDSQLWRVKSVKPESLNPGTEVRITDIEGNSLIVESIHPEDTSAGLANTGSPEKV
ncbi:MAG: NfeD family protein [Candidatus Thermoplasmatota archaeon]|nr:NfeD family protein [Candidatus Thermoplasmatota archaeon]